ncbi:Vacuolar segregation protein pep7 [Wickerhamomyces ciferrii]|uniref:Vacuolar segregation protein pep7 n=1 Tax=Wickerhamomyces ciferrii (strain ATCC 14091 / BCRC 22168 / CBS 111 / JCM 3599 / NBRC 0793 / NRRL Y-1031 F-60-10) TaxID=1206466 RepID=K0KGP5_WICCF|nr:Vacuolar segregation protein pep7 [Wickerhamomyces ciferrii]CCH42151.1 Vacuolar segregation protein pep7 [Wickerhamomyces ciferrii]
MSSDSIKPTKAGPKRVIGSSPKRHLGVPKPQLTSHSRSSSNSSNITPIPSPLSKEQRFNSPSLEDHITPTKSKEQQHPPKIQSLVTPDIVLSDPEIIEGSELINPFIVDEQLQSLQPEFKENGEIIEESISCPICDEKMVSLLQLNRHLDDAHTMDDTLDGIGAKSPSLEPTNDDIKSWLQKTNEMKSKLQTALPRKFVKLDIFDNNNNNFSISDSSSRDSSSTSLNTVTPEITVTRKHWKKPTGHDRCSALNCKKILNIKNGLVNCRKCGDLFCHEHANFRVKLNNSANYFNEGVWCKCCENCFTQKPGYNDFGLVNDVSNKFKILRQKRSDEKQLYLNKLEKRIINLTTAISKIDKEYKSNEFNNNFLRYTISNKKREAEQQLVLWEDGNTKLNCFLCLRNFSFTLRKHHCRLCGKVVCASESTGCSKEIPINYLTESLDDVPKINDDSLLRMCRNCKDVLFIKRNFIKDTKNQLSPLLEKFEAQQSIKRAIVMLMPRFQDMLYKLQNDSSIQNKSITADASKLRKKLMDSFASFDKLTKEIVLLTPENESESKIQLSVQTDSIKFIQKNMIPLKSLPKILKQKEDLVKSQTPPKLNHEQIQKIKQNREELMVLNEQKFLVGEMIENCKNQRKFDELPTLQDNMDELERNIQVLQLSLGNEGF